MILIIIGIVVSIAFIIVLLCNRNNFPRPTGNYGIGTTSYHLIDAQRIEPNNPEAQRELMLRIWYPTDSTKILDAPYDRDALENAVKFINQQSSIPLWLLRGLNKTKTYAKPNAPVSLNKSTYPVIIISHGAGPMIEHYTALCEELASNGYIVVGVNHPYMAPITRFPDSRIIEGLLNAKKKEGKEVAKIWKKEQFETAVQDIEFVLDSLEKLNIQSSWFLSNKLDLENIGICGHSSGGALAMRMCMEDGRLKAGVALDSEIKDDKIKPFPTPFLAIVGKKSHIWAGSEGKKAEDKLVQLSQAQNMHMTIIRFKNAGHGVFYDLPLLFNTTLLTQIISKYIDLDINASSSQARDLSKKANGYVVNFFDTQLKNKS